MSSDINVQTFSGKVNINNNLLVGSGHLFVDTQNNLVGLRTSDPQAGLHVESNTYVRDDFRVGSGIVMNDTSGQITAGSFVGDGSALQGINSDSGSWVNGTSSNVHLATTGDKVGIGVVEPLYKLDVDGDINITSGSTLRRNGTPAVFSNWDVSGSDIYRSSGNVGIGNTAPAFPLTIGTSDGNKIQFNESESAPGHNITCTSGWQWNFNAARSGEDDDAKITFNISGSSGYDEMMRVNHTGVGIGTTDPQAGLHIDNAGNGLMIEQHGQIKHESNQAYYGLIFKNPGSNHTKYMGYAYGGGFTIGEYDPGDDGFTDGLTITNSNVGIGTTSPNHKLEVNGGILADYIGVNFANFYGVRIGQIIEHRFTGMPSSAPTDEASMNAEFGSKNVSSLHYPSQMRLDASAFDGTSYTNIARQWLGVILAPTTGTYTFGVNSDDASDLFVAGSRVADWYSGHGYSGTIISPGGNQRTIYLKGGQWYKIKARFEENGGGEAFYALWKKPGDSSFSEIPSDHLGYTNSDFTSGNSVTSDDRLKVNEKHITSATDTLLKLKPQVYDKYEMIEDVQNTKKHPVKESGLIAQDVWYDAPELKHLVDSYITPNETRTVSDDIQKDPDYSDWGPYPAQVNYIGFIPYIIKSNQEIYTELQTTRTDLQTTRTDLQTTRTDLQTTRTQLEGDLQTTRTDLQTTRTQLEGELQTTRTQLEGELQAEKTENEITRLKLANAESRISILEQSISSILSKLNV